MAFDTLTAITELVKTNLNKFVPNKMSESEKANLATDMERFVVSEASRRNSTFRSFILDYEGAAKDVPRLIVVFLALIRPYFTVLVGYFDWIYFSGVKFDKIVGRHNHLDRRSHRLFQGRQHPCPGFLVRRTGPQKLRDN